MQLTFRANADIEWCFARTRRSVLYNSKPPHRANRLPTRGIDANGWQEKITIIFEKYAFEISYANSTHSTARDPVGWKEEVAAEGCLYLLSSIIWLWLCGHVLLCITNIRTFSRLNYANASRGGVRRQSWMRAVCGRGENISQIHPTICWKFMH